MTALERGTRHEGQVWRRRGTDVVVTDPVTWPCGCLFGIDEAKNAVVVEPCQARCPVFLELQGMAARRPGRPIEFRWLP